jgi:hypothetical protein
MPIAAWGQTNQATVKAYCFSPFFVSTSGCDKMQNQKAKKPSQNFQA